MLGRYQNQVGNSWFLKVFRAISRMVLGALSRNGYSCCAKEMNSRGKSSIKSLIFTNSSYLLATSCQAACEEISSDSKLGKETWRTDCDVPFVTIETVHAKRSPMVAGISTISRKQSNSVSSARFRFSRPSESSSTVERGVSTLKATASTFAISAQSSIKRSSVRLVLPR